MEHFKEWLALNESTSLPPVLYHVTTDVESILRSGQFLPARKQGAGCMVLGGCTDDAVSFTTERNAYDYQFGLEIWRLAAQGQIKWSQKDSLWDIANSYVLPHRTFDSILKEVEFEHRNDPNEESRLYSFLNKISFYSGIQNRKIGNSFLPLIIGQGTFPPRLKTSRGIGILSIGTSPGNGKTGPQKYQYAASEHEWKVYDPENFDYTTMKIVSRGN